MADNTQQEYRNMLVELDHVPGVTPQPPAARYDAIGLWRFVTEDTDAERSAQFKLMLEQNVHWWRKGASALAFPNLHERALLTARWVWERWADASDDHRIDLLNGVLQLWHQLGKQRQLITPPRRGESIGWIGEALSDLRPEVLGCVDAFHMMQVGACAHAYLLFGENAPLSSLTAADIAEFGDEVVARAHVLRWRVAVIHIMSDCLLTTCRMGEDENRAKILLMSQPVLLQLARRAGTSKNLAIHKPRIPIMPDVPLDVPAHLQKPYWAGVDAWMRGKPIASLRALYQGEALAAAENGWRTIQALNDA